MVLRTSIILGTRETPNFISKEMYDCIKCCAAINSFDVTFDPNTIRYYVPYHNVIERAFPAFQEYMIDINDAEAKPRCVRRNLLEKTVFKLKQPSNTFDRIEIQTEEIESQYFLLLPNATYYHTVIWTDQSTSHIVYDGHIFRIHFRRVFLDPHSNSTGLWFTGKPRFQVVVESNHDFRRRPNYLKKAMIAILPRAFKWDTASGPASFPN